MNLTRFDQCLKFTLNPLNDGQPSHDTPGDPGRGTAWGIAIETLSEFKRHQCTTADLRNMSVETRDLIYQTMFWRVAGANLAPGCDLMAFDAGVVLGPETSALLLQETVGAHPDGRIGPETLKMVDAFHPATLIQALNVRHIAHFRSLPTWLEFGRGALARCERRRMAALAACAVVGEAVS